MDFGDTRRHHWIRPRWCRREHATTGADQTPGPRPVTLSRRAARCWPSAGLRGGQRRCRCMFSGLRLVSCNCGRSLSRLSPPVPGPLGGRGHTCRTPPRACSHLHGPAPLAPVVTVDRSCAHGRVHSDRAVDRPCSRLIRPQGPHPRTAAWRACPRKSHAVGFSWWYAHVWTARGTACRFRRPEDSGKDHPAGKYVANARSRKRAATQRSSG